MALLFAPRGLRAFLLPTLLFFLAIMLVFSYRGVQDNDDFFKDLSNNQGGANNNNNNNNGNSHRRPPNPSHPAPKYKPTAASLIPPPVKDPFPLLATSTATPPPIPPYNVPRPGMHREYGLSYSPPLFIGFTRQWPMLLQCVVSYITAGWPPESIVVVENTGVQESNAKGQLTLQNPFYLNHTTLRRLGVTIVQTPVLLTFSQLQNYFLAQAHARSWPYYFYSHQDVLVYSFEDGADTLRRPGDREWFFYDVDDENAVMRPPAAGQKGYHTLYENCLRELNVTLEREDRWAFRWFQYDHLTLVNRAALDAVGGYDSLMPYYGSDCDMNARLGMDGWSMKFRRVGIINDVSTVMEDLLALYRDPKVTAKFIDPNPAWEAKKAAEKAEKEKAEKEQKQKEEKEKQKGEQKGDGKPKEESNPKEGEANKTTAPEPANTAKPTKQKRASGGRDEKTMQTAKSIEYFRELVRVGDEMGAYKYRDENNNRNSWQATQHGGMGEPYYYPADGFATSFWILTEAGREIFRQKWGHRGCDLVPETNLNLDDQWRVEKDWEDDKGKSR